MRDARRWRDRERRRAARRHASQTSGGSASVGAKAIIRPRRPPGADGALGRLVLGCGDEADERFADGGRRMPCAAARRAAAATAARTDGCAGARTLRSFAGSAPHAASRRCMRTESVATSSGRQGAAPRRPSDARGGRRLRSAASSARHADVARHGIAVADGKTTPTRSDHSAGGRRKSVFGSRRTPAARRFRSLSRMALQPATPTARSRS